MQHSRKLGFLLAVALLALSLAAPAAAKKGGHPGPPSGSDLEVTVTRGYNFAWANSAGDEIPFEITVTNTGNETLTVDSVTFEADSIELWSETPGDPLGKNESWSSTTYVHTVTEVDLAGMPFQERSELVAGTVTATAEGLEDSAPATTTASPVGLCWLNGGEFSLGHQTDYTVCSAQFEDAASYWMITATGLPRTGKGSKRSGDVFLTMRDGVPGNWCTVVPIKPEDWDFGVYEGSQTEWETTIDGAKQLTRFMFFPPFTANDGVPDGTCLGGGAGGETITTRNGENHLFYLAYQGAVEATPCTGGVKPGIDDKLTCLQTP